MSGKTLLRYYLPVELAGPLLRGEEQPAWSSRRPSSEPCWGARSLPQARSWKAGCVPAVPTALDVAKICSNLGICAARVFAPSTKAGKVQKGQADALLCAWRSWGGTAGNGSAVLMWPVSGCCTSPPAFLQPLEPQGTVRWTPFPFPSDLGSWPASFCTKRWMPEGHFNCTRWQCQLDMDWLRKEKQNNPSFGSHWDQNNEILEMTWAIKPLSSTASSSVYREK